MKKFLVLSLLAVSMAIVSEQSAHAWINLKFGAGFNFGFQSGNNKALFGLWRNGPIGGYDDPNCQGYPGYPYPYSYAPLTTMEPPAQTPPAAGAPAPSPAQQSQGNGHFYPQAMPVSLPSYYPYQNYYSAYPNNYPAYPGYYYPGYWFGR